MNTPKTCLETQTWITNIRTEHIPALLQGLLFVISINMTSCVRIAGSKVVHGIHVLGHFEVSICR